MKEITKYQSAELSKVNSQVQIHNELLAEFDIYYELFNINLIKQATELAITSRLYLDPYYDKKEMDNASINSISQKVYSRIIDGNFDTVELYKISFPKNKFEQRMFSYYDITSYALRFLFAIIIHRKYTKKECVFGGQNDIFSKHNTFTDVYQKHKEDFWNWQKGKIKSNSYNWIYIADIKDYYKSISINILSKQLNKHLGINSFKFFSAFKKCYNEITIGSWCDHFIQNIYLFDIDNSLSKLDGISYARFTDDIRVFCKKEKDCKIVHDLIVKELESLDLEINNDKRFVIQELSEYLGDEFVITDLNNYQKDGYSHYIKIKDIDKYNVENLIRIKTNSIDIGINFLSKYEQEKLPKHLTHKNRIEGKSGFTINGIEMLSFIDKLESGYYNVDLIKLQSLARIIEFSYGSYTFYFKVIRLYIKLVTQIHNKNQLSLENSFNDLLHAIGYSPFDKIEDCLKTQISYYKAYIFIRVIFSDLNENEKFFSNLSVNRAIRISMVGVFLNILIKGPYYLGSEVFFHLTKDYTNELKLKNGEKFCYSINYWKKIFRLINNEHSIHHEGYKRQLINYLLELLPDAHEIKLLHANILKSEKKYRDAIALYLELENQGQNVSNFNLAYCYVEVGNKEEALLRYTKELQSKQSSAAFNNRSLLYQEFNNLEKALEDLNNAINLETEELYYLNRAKLKVKLGDLQSAIEDIESAYLLDKNVELIKYKAKVYVKHRKTEQAIIEIERYCDLKGWTSEDVRNREIAEIKGEKPKPLN